MTDERNITVLERQSIDPETGEINAPAITNNMIADGVSTDELIRLGQEALARTKAFKNIKHSILYMTNSKDWASFDKKSDVAYLTEAGAEKIATPAGIWWERVGNEKVAMDDAHYMYLFEMLAHMGNRTIPAMGTCSTKDKFFSHGQKKHPKDIDETNIIKKARTNCIRNGIVSILGLKNITFAELLPYGIKKEQCCTVDIPMKITNAEGVQLASDKDYSKCWALLYNNLSIQENAYELFAKLFGKDINKENHMTAGKALDFHKNYAAIIANFKKEKGIE